MTDMVRPVKIINMKAEAWDSDHRKVWVWTPVTWNKSWKRKGERWTKERSIERIVLLDFIHRLVSQKKNKI